MNSKIMVGTLNSPTISYSVEFYNKAEIMNITPYPGKVSNATDTNTIEILNIYKERFNEAWEELANK